MSTHVEYLGTNIGVSRTTRNEYTVFATSEPPHAYAKLDRIDLEHPEDWPSEAGRGKTTDLPRFCGPITIAVPAAEGDRVGLVLEFRLSAHLREFGQALIRIAEQADQKYDPADVQQAYDTALAAMNRRRDEPPF